MSLSVSTMRHLPETNALSTRELDALLCHLLACRRIDLYTSPERLVTIPQLDSFHRFLQQLETGKPLEHITGHCDFFSMRLQVSDQVLIPRPETELLVETGLSLLSDHAEVLELGTGSGAIALALLRNADLPLRLCATELSPDALALARHNAQQWLDEEQLSRLSFVQGSWFDPIRSNRQFDLILSNPPYVAEDDPDLDPAVPRYEPMLALLGGEDGLNSLREIVAQAPQYLRSGGHLLVEHGKDQQDAVASLMQQAGLDAQCITDKAGLPRITSGRLRDRM